MNKTVIFGIIGIVVVGGGVALYVKGGGVGSPMGEGLDREQMTAQTMKGSLKDLMTRGSSVCTVHSSVENSDSSGTVYVGAGKMRGDFTSVTKNPAMTIESHMISDGEYVYTWSSAMPQGVKIAVASAESATGQDGQPNMYASEVGYDCESWSVDNSKFTLPAGVTFTDLGAMMQGIPAAVKAGAGVPSPVGAQCSACDMAPEPQRSQCRAALNCK